MNYKIIYIYIYIYIPACQYHLVRPRVILENQLAHWDICFAVREIAQTQHLAPTLRGRLFCSHREDHFSIGLQIYPLQERKKERKKEKKKEEKSMF